MIPVSIWWNFISNMRFCASFVVFFLFIYPSKQLRKNNCVHFSIPNFAVYGLLFVCNIHFVFFWKFIAIELCVV